VLVNAGDSEVQESILVANSKLMNGAPMLDALKNNQVVARVYSGVMDVKLPARSALVLKPDVSELLNNGADQGAAERGYTPYKRVQ
jgi:hypothetical protein